jgi:alpha-mannosidase
MSDPSPAPAPKPLYYTFGNHMHWVDMQWLWGYDVLPGSVRDMLTLIRETGAKGNVNFDGIGYEKMAAECPEALADLRAAVQAGDVEPVGCSYGQPYGLFHGLESNIRQLTYGVRSVMRLLGVRPRTFWEEEFYFLPQLPQILRGCGYDGACLFFQWTWHTPEVPKERASLIQWEGVDGSSLPTLPRNELNVHQWPEDFDGLLEGELLRELSHPAVVQWLELMPSRDWMCRSEVILPRLKELMADERFEVRPRTCAELIDELQEQESPEKIPTRRYGMHQVWHGMTLGKNGDRHPRLSRMCEGMLQVAETASALVGLFGRDYPRWDVYPTWEIEEGWRELLVAQHHDNHECEGLCGDIGYRSMERASGLATGVRRRVEATLRERLIVSSCALSSAGWPTKRVIARHDEANDAAVTLPPFGYSTGHGPCQALDLVKASEAGRDYVLSRPAIKARIDRAEGVLQGIESHDPAVKRIRFAQPFPQLCMLRDCEVEKSKCSCVELQPNTLISLRHHFSFDVEREAFLSLCLTPTEDAVDFTAYVSNLTNAIQSGLNASMQIPVVPDFEVAVVLADTPGSVYEVKAGQRVRRKYPSGDWMTSQQWFEEVHDPFTSHSFVDLLRPDGTGLLVVHEGSQQWFRDPDGVRAVIAAGDAWDQVTPAALERFALRLIPHQLLTNSERVKLARVFNSSGPDLRETAVAPGDAGPDQRDTPAVFGPLSVENAPNVLAHAFFRESMKSGEHLPNWAGHRMFAESNGACDHPYVARLVEWDGEPAEVTLKLAGEVALAAKTNLMGEVDPHKMTAGSQQDTGWLKVEPTDPPDFAKDAKFKGEPIPWSQVRFRMRPHEIATVMADMVMGRKEWRDLDAKREVWATVHRQDERAK